MAHSLVHKSIYNCTFHISWPLFQCEEVLSSPQLCRSICVLHQNLRVCPRSYIWVLSMPDIMIVRTLSSTSSSLWSSYYSHSYDKICGYGMGFSFIIKLTNCLTFRLSRWVNYIHTLKADSFSKLLQQRKSEGPNMGVGKIWYGRRIWCFNDHAANIWAPWEQSLIDS